MLCFVIFRATLIKDENDNKTKKIFQFIEPKDASIKVQEEGAERLKTEIYKFTRRIEHISLNNKKDGNIN